MGRGRRADLPGDIYIIFVCKLQYRNLTFFDYLHLDLLKFDQFFFGNNPVFYL